MREIDNNSGDDIKVKGKKPRKSGVVKFLVTMLLIGISLLSAYILNIYVNLPSISELETYLPNETSIIYDDKKQVLAKIRDEENRTVIPLEQMPVQLRQAVISMEDERFYKHPGVDIKALFRATASLIDPGERFVKSGGSTITQQLARNVFLTRDRTIKRKVSEILLALKIDRTFSKDEILEYYLNEVYWGHNAYGIEAASKTYFGKPAKELTLKEATLIAGILSAPEVYSPYKNLKKAKWRQALTLEKMQETGFINAAEAENVKVAEVRLVGLKEDHKIRHPYFTNYVMARLMEQFDRKYLVRGGLQIYTTIDTEEQAYAEKLIRETVQKYGKYRRFSQGALVSIDPEKGHIKSLVGGADHSKSQFNRITQAKRQPGSAFKPFVYLTAFRDGVLTPDQTVVDAPVTFARYNNWSPRNYTGRYNGAMTAKRAIQYSINTVAVKTMDQVGISSVIETAHDMGIESELPPYPSLALGAAEVTPLELARAYGVFAAGGRKVSNVTPILKVLDRDGNVLIDNTVNPMEKTYYSSAVSMLNESLLATVNSGTGTAARLPGREVGGKTGTTSDYKDAWFVGYIPQRVTLVWVGNDNNQKMRRVTGGDICAPVWKKYMAMATKDMEKLPLPKEKSWLEMLGFKKLKEQEKLAAKEKAVEESEEIAENPETDEYTFKRVFRRIMESVTSPDPGKADVKKEVQIVVPTVDQQYEGLVNERKQQAEKVEEEETVATPRPVRRFEENPYTASEPVEPVRKPEPRLSEPENKPATPVRPRVETKPAEPVKPVAETGPAAPAVEARPAPPKPEVPEVSKEVKQKEPVEKLTPRPERRLEENPYLQQSAEVGAGIQ